MQEDFLAVSSASKYKISVIVFSKNLDYTLQNVESFLYLLSYWKKEYSSISVILFPNVIIVC